jgi:type III secretion protein R
MIDTVNPLALALFLAILALLPIVVVMATSFVKIAVVSMLLRNALGVQQVPPNIALYGLALILTGYVMAPVCQHMYQAVTAAPGAMESVTAFISTLAQASEPLRDFLARNTHPEQQEFFVKSAQRLWPPELASQVEHRDFMVLVPAFLVTELTAAFKMGFLLYLPFVVIDLLVQSVLLALGMMMMSPMTVSLPLKLLLFVMADGWSRLIHGLVLSYAGTGTPA